MIAETCGFSMHINGSAMRRNNPGGKLILKPDFPDMILSRPNIPQGICQSHGADNPI